MTTTHSAERLAPHVLRHRLSRDVTKILATSIQHFADVEREIEEKHFDVDAIISGREIHATPIATIVPRQVRTVHTAPASAAYQYTAAARGSFIPSAHFSKRFA